MRPMLATKGTHVPRGGEWLHEVKWDGIRVLVRVTGSAVQLWSRNENNVSLAYPELQELAGSGLEARGGVRTGVGGRTALPHVFAAGDVTGGGHWDAAARQGAGVARALLGLDPAPPAPPSFWSDQLGLRLQCVGEPAGAHATIAADPEGRGFEAVYRRDGRVSAVLLAGRSAADLRAARRLLTPEPQLERSAA